MGCGNSTASGAGGRGATGTTKDVSQIYFQPSLVGVMKKQKNPYQMMTKGGTMVASMLACRRMRLPWFPVRRKLHRKIRRK